MTLTNDVLDTLPADHSIIIVDYTGDQNPHRLFAWTQENHLPFAYFSDRSGMSYDPFAGLTVEQQTKTLLSMAPSDPTLQDVAYTLCTLMDHAITRRAALRGTARLAVGPSLTWDQGRLAFLYSAVVDTETVANLVGSCQHTPVAESAMRFLTALEESSVQNAMSTLREQLTDLMESPYGFWLRDDGVPNTISLIESSHDVTLFSLDTSLAATYIGRMIAANLDMTSRKQYLHVNRHNTMENV